MKEMKERETTLLLGAAGIGQTDQDPIKKAYEEL